MKALPKKCALALMTSALLASAPVYTQTQSRIISGYPASTASYPWLASLYIDSELSHGFGALCGGTLIAPTWILTAAHCFLNDAGSRIDPNAASRSEATFNSDDIDRSATAQIRVTGKRALIHPNYNPSISRFNNENNYDLALLELSHAVNLPVIKLFMGQAPVNTQMIVAGWGVTTVDDLNSSGRLFQAQQLLVDHTRCDAIYGGSVITQNMLCAGGFTDTDTADTCQGDSGGPMFVNLTTGALQIGVTSFGGSGFGPSCGDPNAPGVYTNIARLSDFIKSSVPSAAWVTTLDKSKAQRNEFNTTTGLLILPKVSVSGVNYSVTLQHIGDLRFQLQAAQVNDADDMNAMPSYYDQQQGRLHIPVVQVGTQQYQAVLLNQGDFNFNTQTAQLW